jgi:hypothetical protein
MHSFSFVEIIIFGSLNSPTKLIKEKKNLQATLYLVSLACRGVAIQQFPW